MMDEAAAIKKLIRLCAGNTEPVLDGEDLQEIIQQSSRFTVHAVSTAYEVNQRVIPAAANGRMYRCIESGTSGATAPEWPTLRGSRLGFCLSDGTVLWEDDGVAYDERYDLGAAANAAWTEKAARTADEINFASDKDKYDLEQRHQHCVAMAARFTPMFAE